VCEGWLAVEDHNQQFNPRRSSITIDMATPRDLGMTDDDDDDVDGVLGAPARVGVRGGRVQMTPAARRLTMSAGVMHDGRHVVRLIPTVRVPTTKAAARVALKGCEMYRDTCIAQGMTPGDILAAAPERALEAWVRAVLLVEEPQRVTDEHLIAALAEWAAQESNVAEGATMFFEQEDGSMQYSLEHMVSHLSLVTAINTAAQAQTRIAGSGVPMGKHIASKLVDKIVPDVKKASPSAADLLSTGMRQLEPTMPSKNKFELLGKVVANSETALKMLLRAQVESRGAALGGGGGDSGGGGSTGSKAKSRDSPAKSTATKDAAAAAGGGGQGKAAAADKKCYRCGQLGHIRSACKSKEADGASAAPAAVAVPTAKVAPNSGFVNKTRGGNFQGTPWSVRAVGGPSGRSVPARIGGVLTQVRLDSGCDLPLVASARHVQDLIARGAQIHRTDTVRRVTSAFGNELDTVVYRTDVSLGQDKAYSANDVEMTVFEGPVHDAEVPLVGQPFLEARGLDVYAFLS